jgi:disulfide bond formation protein DsbB
MHRRACFGLLALAATGLTLAGWWIGEWMKLQPCPLCIFQRLLYLLIAGVALAGLLLPGWRSCGAGCSACPQPAGWRPRPTRAGCSICPTRAWRAVFGEPNLIERIVDWFGVRWPAMFMASGFCSSKDWVFLGLSMANWSVLCFFAFLVAALWLSLPVKGAPTTRDILLARLRGKGRA